MCTFFFTDSKNYEEALSINLLQEICSKHGISIEWQSTSISCNNVKYKVTIDFNGTVESCEASGTKKEAKRNAAKSMLKSAFDISFSPAADTLNFNNVQNLKVVFLFSFLY